MGRTILPLSVCIIGLLAAAGPSHAIDFYEIEIYGTDTTPAGHLQLGAAFEHDLDGNRAACQEPD